MATKTQRNIAIVIAVTIILGGVISYRIYANIAANKKRAQRVSGGRAVVVETAPVTRRDITPKLVFSANLEPVWIADIAPKVDGRIDQLYVDVGDTVKAGAVITTLDTAELSAQVVQAEGNLLAARASLEQAELDLKRTEALASQGAVSVQAADTARTKRDLAAGQVRAAEGNLALLQARLANANVVVPRDGIVVKRYLQAGAYVKTGSPIVQVANTAEFLAKTTVGESQVNELAVGSPVRVRIDALGGMEFSGQISRISPAAALPARTFTAEVTIPNTEGLLKMGMFAKVESLGQPRNNVLAVPESALVMKEDQKTVFVVTGDNTVRQKVLKLGSTGDGWVEVLEGLQEGEIIVVGGQNKVKDGATVAPAQAKAGTN